TGRALRSSTSKSISARCTGAIRERSRAEWYPPPHGHSRILLRLLEPVDLPRVPQGGGGGARCRRRARLATVPGRRCVKQREPVGLRDRKSTRLNSSN